MQSGADAGEAPGLIDAQVGDESGTRKPKFALLIVRPLSLTIAPLKPKNAALVTSTVPPPLRVAGSSSESVPEKPLPNWAV